MSNSKKQYTREYKMEVLALLKSSGKRKVALEKKLGLYPGQLPAWEQTLAREGKQAFPGTGRQTETDTE